ncbi:MAG TPA: FAD-binding protein [Chloroflexota bacterium]|nr:FAD-binding protein [Chloroflexota bacterium]
MVARYYEPSCAAEVQHIVQEARRNGKKVRVAGDSHSWSPLSLTDDYLIGTRRFNRILRISATPPQITVEPGVTIAETLRAFSAHGVCLPMNVDIPTLTIGGAVAVGSNGFSRKWGRIPSSCRKPSW